VRFNAAAWLLVVGREEFRGATSLLLCLLIVEFLWCVNLYTNPGRSRLNTDFALTADCHSFVRLGNGEDRLPLHEVLAVVDPLLACCIAEDVIKFLR
jgi:hypothetical protein